MLFALCSLLSALCSLLSALCFQVQIERAHRVVFSGMVSYLYKVEILKIRAAKCYLLSALCSLLSALCSGFRV